MRLRRLLILLAAVLFILPVPAFSQLDEEPCDLSDIEDLQDQLRCDELRTPDACAGVGLAVAGSMTMFRFKGLFNSGGHQPVPETIAVNKTAIEAARKASAKAQRDAREYARTMIKIIDQEQKSGSETKIASFNRIRDRNPSWNQLHMTYRKKMTALIPNNKMLQRMNTNTTSTMGATYTPITPESYVASEIRSAIKPILDPLPRTQRPTLEKYIDLNQQRMDEYIRKHKERIGIQLTTKGVPFESDRPFTARQASFARKEIKTFLQMTPEQCSILVRRSAAAIGLGAVISTASGATSWNTIKKCAESFQTKLIADDKMFLIEAATNAAGLAYVNSCDEFTMDSAAIEKYLSAPEGKYSPQLGKFLCNYSRNKMKRMVEAKEKEGIITPACNSLTTDGITISKNENALNITLRSGKTATLPLENDTGWNYSGIKSTDPRLNEYLTNKIRHPAVSQAAKKSVLQPEYACKFDFETEDTKNLCDVSKAVQNWNLFSTTAANACNPPTDKFTDDVPTSANK